MDKLELEDGWLQKACEEALWTVYKQRAADDLYSALKELLDNATWSGHPVWDRARAALAKATPPLPTR